MPRFVEVREQGRPRNRKQFGIGTYIGATNSGFNSLPDLIRSAIYYRDFDGGVISEPTEFNDYLDEAFDGGAL